MEKLEKILLFSMLLRTFLAVFLNLCLTAFKGFFLPDTKSYTLNYIFIGLIITFTLVPFIVAWKGGPELLNKPSVEKRIGTLYNVVKTSHWSYFTFTSAFSLRRILFVIILF